MKQTERTFKLWIKDLSPAFPVVLGYLPIGFAYGVLAAGAGMSIFNTLLMSLIVFAGSAQLVAVGLIVQGLNPWAIIATTLIVNLRHMLMSASLSPYMNLWYRGQVAGFCFELTDETFGVHSLRFKHGDPAPGIAIHINLVCHFAWVLGSLLGVLAGGLIRDVRPLGLDYALPAMFIALLIMQLRGSLYVAVALIAAVLSILIWSTGLTQWNVILAAVVAAAVGAGWEQWQTKRC
ncbi:MAG: AzlC family ABC transporter permease [Anaerolineaceae bacterium]|nr:AzlC family ABC transporter permease [Anaerolineaceae bacterium]